MQIFFYRKARYLDRSRKRMEIYCIKMLSVACIIVVAARQKNFLPYFLTGKAEIPFSLAKKLMSSVCKHFRNGAEGE